MLKCCLPIQISGGEGAAGLGRGTPFSAYLKNKLVWGKSSYIFPTQKMTLKNRLEPLVT